MVVFPLPALPRPLRCHHQQRGLHRFSATPVLKSSLLCFVCSYKAMAIPMLVSLMAMVRPFSSLSDFVLGGYSFKQGLLVGLTLPSCTCLAPWIIRGYVIDKGIRCLALSWFNGIIQAQDAIGGYATADWLQRNLEDYIKEEWDDGNAAKLAITEAFLSVSL